MSHQEDGKKVRRKGLLIDKKLQQKLMKRFKCDSSANAPIVSIPYIRQVLITGCVLFQHFLILDSIGELVLGESNCMFGGLGNA